MIPKNIQSFIKKSNELISEVDSIIIDQSIIQDNQRLTLRLNEFRGKCIQFLSASFENPDNEYKKEFEENIHKVEQVSIYYSGNSLNRMMVKHYLEQFDFAKNLLRKALNTVEFIEEVNNDLPSLVSSEGLFFKGQYYDAIFQLNNLIVNAKQEIKLVDNYLNLDLLNFLSNKNNRVSLKIISSAKDIPQLKLGLTGFQNQFSHLQIKESKSYHDRFLIIDNTEVFHFGASFKDLGKKTFMFSKISEPTIQSAIIIDFDNHWSIGNSLFP